MADNHDVFNPDDPPPPTGDAFNPDYLPVGMPRDLEKYHKMVDAMEDIWNISSLFDSTDNDDYLNLDQIQNDNIRNALIDGDNFYSPYIVGLVGQMLDHDEPLPPFGVTNAEMTYVADKLLGLMNTLKREGYKPPDSLDYDFDRYHDRLKEIAAYFRKEAGPTALPLGSNPPPIATLAPIERIRPPPQKKKPQEDTPAYMQQPRPNYPPPSPPHSPPDEDEGWFKILHRGNIPGIPYNFQTFGAWQQKGSSKSLWSKAPDNRSQNWEYWLKATKTYRSSLCSH